MVNEDKEPWLNAKRLKQGFILVFALIAFTMTTYATSGGVRLFLSDSYAWIGITALAVGFLAFTSLVLGDGISTRNGLQIGLVMPFYVIAVILCWICSFASYHQQFLTVGGSDLANSETNLRQMGAFAHDVRRDMNDRYADQKDALLNDPALQTYSAEMSALSDYLRGRDSREEIEAQLQAQIEANKLELADRQRRLRQQEEDARRRVEGFAQRVEAAEQEVQRRRNAVGELEDRIGQLEIALAEEEGDVTLPTRDRGLLLPDSLASRIVDDPACQRRRRAGTGGGLPGTCYNAIGEAIDETTSNVTVAQAAVAEANAQLDEVSSELEAMTLDLDGIVAEIEEAEQEARDAEVAVGYTLDADGFMQSINAFIDQPTQATFRQTSEYCTVVTQLLSDVQTSAELPDCKPQAVTALFAQIDTLEADQAAFTPACEETELREEIIADLREGMRESSGVEREKTIFAAYDRMRKDALETCLVAADARGFDTTGYRADLAGLYDRINPSQDAISQAIGKVSALLSGTAPARDYFPALLALLQELSLLLAKLFWDASSMRKPARSKEAFDLSELDLESKPGDPGPVIASKNIILGATYHRRGHLLPRYFDEEYSQEMRALMRHIVEGLMRKEMATKTSAGFLISEEGMAAIARRIQQPEPEIEDLDGTDVLPDEASATPRVAENENSAEATAALPTAGSQNDDADAGSPEATQAADNPSEAEPMEDDAGVEERPRRRRPVVVRPNFRRET